ncbi:MAG: hypothetical protein JW850_02930 [Thermoflexales bacterium]|nr:hypothetical protein [Thermoflexales bacterium]
MIKVSSLFLLGLILVWAAVAFAPVDARLQAAPAAVDLYIKTFTVTPTQAALYAPVSFTIEACNAPGSDTVGGRRIHLYIDPLDQPPISTTQPTKPLVMYVEWPADACVTWEYSGFTFGQSGPHVAYAWVDPYERIAEIDEANNLKQVQIQVAPEGIDTYEPDDACEQAVEIPTDGTFQVRRFDPAGDVDWVKYPVTASWTYTVTAAGTGAEAHPIFEVWSTCQVPPPTFGGETYQLTEHPKTDGWRYLRLSNDLQALDPAESTYRLSVRSTPAVTGVQPVVNGMTPTWGYNDRNTCVVISGTNLVPQSRAALCPYQAGICQECVHALGNTSVKGSDMFAVLPANLPHGDYCLAVTDPGGKVGRLPGAFSVLPGQPDLRQSYPSQAYADLPGDLNVYGFNFHPGISVSLDSIGLENVVVVNQTRLRATAPAGLAPGSYSLRAFYGTGSASVLPATYTVLSHEDDLFAQAEEMWVNPGVPYTGKVARLGLLVHRLTGTLTLQDVPVRFFVDGQFVGDVYVSSLPPNTGRHTQWLEWTPPATGTYTLQAVIDPLGQIPEASKTNNTVTRTLAVEGATGADAQAPRVNSLAIKTAPGEQPDSDTVTDTLIYLAVQASDTGEGRVTHLRYVELEYNQAAHLWVSLHDSGWVVSDTINANNYRWQLTPVDGLHYIQAWARDDAGNVSPIPYQRGINYLPEGGQVGRGQTHVYRQTLTPGNVLSVTVESTQGDPDLYIWPPDWESGQKLRSTNESTSTEILLVTDTVTGVYQVEVYGYTAARYGILIQVGTQAQARAAAAETGRRSPAAVLGKMWRGLPAVEGEPPLPPLSDTVSVASAALPIEAAGQYNFGATGGILSFADKAAIGTLGHVTVTRIADFPTGQEISRPLPRTYKIEGDGSGFTATLTLHYEDSDLAAAGISDEGQLQLYRYTGSGQWQSYTSTVGQAANLVTATNVISFSTWAIGTEEHAPTAVIMSRLILTDAGLRHALPMAARPPWMLAALGLLVVMCGGVWWIRRRE